MNTLTSFFILCSGADRMLLEKCPTEKTKYAGIGATLFFTGIFAALASAYALFTVFDSVWVATAFGLLWGLMIFNLDRFIVSGMRKEGRSAKEWAMATPRIILALLISIIIARPLELKIFEKEIAPELIVMEQQAYAKQEQELRTRFLPQQDSIKREIGSLKQELIVKSAQRDVLEREARMEADGTGGSRKKNLGPIYKAKKADADKANSELLALVQRNETRIGYLEKSLGLSDSLMTKATASLKQSRIDGPAARLEALDHLMAQQPSVWWAHWFIMLLFIAVETSPIFVKLISSKGPYDNLLSIDEHSFAVQETEQWAIQHAQAKERAATLAEKEKGFVNERLDAALKR